ncbi:dephospho-CoA kinase [Enterococcus sp. LJL98]
MAVVLGVTGGIATGKSTAVGVFSSYGFPVVDGDLIARAIVEPGRPALAAIVQQFGPQILLADGALDRQALGRLIFSQPSQRKRLDHLLEPFLRQAIYQAIEAAKQTAPLVIADIPLLYEGGYQSMVDQVAVVYLPQTLQIERLMTRDQLTKEEAWQRIESQMSIEEKKQQADILFDNQGSIDSLKAQITSWLKAQKYLLQE